MELEARVPRKRQTRGLLRLFITQHSWNGIVETLAGEAEGGATAA
jgi:hypothetical protein